MGKGLAHIWLAGCIVSFCLTHLCSSLLAPEFNEKLDLYEPKLQTSHVKPRDLYAQKIHAFCLLAITKFLLAKFFLPQKTLFAQL